MYVAVQVCSCDRGRRAACRGGRRRRRRRAVTPWGARQVTPGKLRITLMHQRRQFVDRTELRASCRACAFSASWGLRLCNSFRLSLSRYPPASQKSCRLPKAQPRRCFGVWRRCLAPRSACRPPALARAPRRPTAAAPHPRRFGKKAATATAGATDAPPELLPPAPTKEARLWRRWLA